MLYPIKVFRLFLSKCHLNFIALNIFVEKVHGCYRNGLDGGRDMRSFSGLYFFTRIVLYVTGFLTKKLSNNIWSVKEIWFFSGTVFFATTLVLGLVQPYKKDYMNYVDTLMLANLTLMCYVIPGLSDLPRFLITRILLFTPIVTFVALIMLKKLQPTIRNIKNFCRIQCVLHKANPFVETEEHQPLIQPT